MEIWDIYDKNKRPTGRTMIRDDFHLKEGEYHLSVLGVIERTPGVFLITQRKLDKKWAPGWWEIPGGGVQAGETSEKAIARELFEETGLDVSGAEGGLAFTYERTNRKLQDNYFVDVYKFRLEFDEKDLKLLEEEVDGYMLADRETIKKFAGEGIFLHYDSIKKVFD